MVAVAEPGGGRARSLLPGGERRVLALLASVTVAVLAVLVTAPGWLPAGALTLLVVPAGFLLDRRSFVAYGLLVVLGVAAVALYLGRHAGTVDPALAVPPAVIAVMGYLLRGRFSLGMAGTHPEHLLIELHERLSRSMRLPVLPAGWHAQARTEPASGHVFGGDVVVSSRVGDLLEVTMVDVSGNGLAAAARATQLTGALGALIGSVPPQEFLARANAYVSRQGWCDGFATVVHVAVDLVTGQYTIGRAGHPAPLVRQSATGRWLMLEGSSSLPLGVSDRAEFPRRAGMLDPGDCLVLYSDGLVESRAVGDLTGTRRLQRVAARTVAAQGPAGLAARITSAAPSTAEDRTVVVVWRDPA